MELVDERTYSLQTSRCYWEPQRDNSGSTTLLSPPDNIVDIVSGGNPRSIEGAQADTKYSLRALRSD